MKKIALFLLSLVIIGVAVLWLQGKDMREIRTEIVIAAPPEAVWRVITDIEHWDQWSPIIQASEGQASLGSQLTITMVSEEGKGGKDGPRYQPIITQIDPTKSFRWRAKMIANFVFTNDKSFELERTNQGTRLIHKELFSGLMVPMFWGKVKANVPAMLDSMNEALRMKVEQQPLVD